MELRASELAMILDGIDVSKLKRVPRYERAARSSEERIQQRKKSAQKKSRCEQPRLRWCV